MWSWFQRWRACISQKVARRFLRLSGPRCGGIEFRYEKAGLTVTGEPIPWNAEAVLVEVAVRLPPSILPHKSDFQLRTAERAPRMAVALFPDSGEGTHRVIFRLPPIQASTPVVVYYQGSVLGQMLLPFLSEETFLRGLRLGSPTLFTRLGDSNVACQTVVEGQYRGLSAGGILTSPTSLLPITDFPLRMEILDRSAGCIQNLSLGLSGPQLLDREALLSVALPSCCGSISSVRWILGDRLLAHADLRVISSSVFQQSLYLLEGRFCASGKQRAPLFRHHLLACDDTRGLRPCFIIASREPGVAGLCQLEVGVQSADANVRSLIGHQEILVTDKPVMFIPDVTSMGDCGQVRAFELLSNGQLLGALPVSPTPAAVFTSEGGFHPAADFDWTRFSEEELVDRLQRLMEASEDEKNVYGHAECSEKNARSWAFSYVMTDWQSHPTASVPGGTENHD